MSSSGDNSHFLDWAKHFEAKPPDNVRRLFFLRYVTWRLQERPDDNSVGEQGREFAYIWLKYLAEDAAQGKSFFLQHYLRSYVPPFFYGENPTELRPTSRKSWDNGWCEILPWLRRPQSLTILEIEMALAIFKWESKKPELVWWVQEYPHILRRIHAMLLRSYGFALLGPLTRAMKVGGETSSRGTSHPRSLYQAPYLASTGWRIYPRLGGLVTIGLLGILSINYLLAPLYAAPLRLVAAGGVAALALTYRLILMDVFKQNRGVLVSACHARPRTLGVLWRVLAWGGAGTLAVFGALRLILSHFLHRPNLQNWTAYQQLPDMALPHLAAQPWWHWFLRFTVMGLGAVLLGLLLQWFWEDRSVIEPI